MLDEDRYPQKIQVIPYAQSFTIPFGTMVPVESLYKKRKWVPRWLWNKVAQEDLNSALLRFLFTRERQEPKPTVIGGLGCSCGMDYELLSDINGRVSWRIRKK